MPKKFLIMVILTLMLSGCGASEIQPSEFAVSVRSEQAASEDTQSTFFAVQREAEQQLQTSDPAQYSDTETGEDTAGESGTQYFSFRRATRDQSDDNGVVLLTENRCYIDFHTPDPDVQKWMDDILAEHQAVFDAKSRNLVRYAEEIVSQDGTEYFYTYSNYQEQGVLRHDSRIVSLVTLSHVHSGGPHPNSVQTVANLDLSRLKELRLEDVIQEGGADELETMIQRSVKQKFGPLGEGALYEEYQEIIRTSMKYGGMTPYWYFTEDGLAVFYNQYELGPYAAGIITVEIPYDELRGILREEFFPEKIVPHTGDLKVCTDIQGLEQIPLMIEPGGKQTAFTANGQIRQVQISEVYWVDDTPVTQEMLMSINQLDAGQALVITGGFEDEERSYAVAFQDGTGKHRVYYIGCDGSLMDSGKS